MFVALPFLLFTAVILNGFAAGVVSVLHFWGKNGQVGLRAALGSIGSGICTLLVFSGFIFFDPTSTRDGIGVMTGISVIFFAGGMIVSLPGAFLMSRKIGDTMPINPDTFD